MYSMRINAAAVYIDKQSTEHSDGEEVVSDVDNGFNAPHSVF